MKQHEFVKRVAELAVEAVDSPSVQPAIDAVLSTLGECLGNAALDQLASEVPPDLREAFYQYRQIKGSHAPMPPTDLDEFWDRVIVRAGIPHRDAKRIGLAALETLRECVSAGTFDKMQIRMPFPLNVPIPRTA